MEAVRMDRLRLAAEEVPWTEIPGVRVIGLVIGAVLLFVAIRAMFRR